MLVLAITDLVTVVIDAILDTALPMFGLVLSSANKIICASYMFLSWLTTITSYYLTVLFSLDKCLAVSFPYFYRMHGKPKVVVVATVLSFVILSSYVSPAVFVFRIHPATETCRPTEFGIVSREFFFETRTRIGTFVSGIIPIGCVFVFTAITIVKIRQQSRKLTNGRRGNSATRRDREVTRQMIVVSILFAIFCSGFTSCIVLKQRIQVKTAENEANRSLLEAIQFTFMALTNSANFYVYMIFGKKFRGSFWAIFAWFNRGGHQGNTNASPDQVAETAHWAENKTEQKWRKPCQNFVPTVWL